jgi:hypothetical protein
LDAHEFGFLNLPSDLSVATSKLDGGGKCQVNHASRMSFS